MKNSHFTKRPISNLIYLSYCSNHSYGKVKARHFVFIKDCFCLFVQYTYYMLDGKNHFDRIAH